MILEVILYLLVFATSWPMGLLLAWLCEDEIIKDRKYFFMMSYFLIICLILIFIFFFNKDIILAIIYLIVILVILIRRGRKLEAKIKSRKSKR